MQMCLYLRSASECVCIRVEVWRKIESIVCGSPSVCVRACECECVSAFVFASVRTCVCLCECLSVSVSLSELSAKHLLLLAYLLPSLLDFLLLLSTTPFLRTLLVNTIPFLSTPRPPPAHHHTLSQYPLHLLLLVITTPFSVPSPLAPSSQHHTLSQGQHIASLLLQHTVYFI